MNGVHPEATKAYILKTAIYISKLFFLISFWIRLTYKKIHEYFVSKSTSFNNGLVRKINSHDEIRVCNTLFKILFNQRKFQLKLQIHYITIFLQTKL